MDALELALRCSSLLKRSMVLDSGEVGEGEGDSSAGDRKSSLHSEKPFLSPLRSHEALNESDCERHFKDYGEKCTSEFFTSVMHYIT